MLICAHVKDKFELHTVLRRNSTDFVFLEINKGNYHDADSSWL